MNRTVFGGLSELLLTTQNIRVGGWWQLAALARTQHFTHNMPLPYSIRAAIVWLVFNIVFILVCVTSYIFVPDVGL